MHHVPALAHGSSGRTMVVRNRALAFASVAASGPRKLLQSILRWKHFKVPNSTATNGNRATTRSGSKLRTSHQAGATDSHGRPGAGGARNVGIVWFRSDLRLHDNEALTRANAECTSLLPVYCFDPREYGRSALGYDRTGPYLASFLVEAVADLRARLQAAGSDLLVRIGKPEEVLSEMARKVGASAVYCHSDVTPQGCKVEHRVAEAVEATGSKMKTFWGNTLHHIQDLPFKLTTMPSNFDVYKSKLGAIAPRAALGAVKDVRGLPLGGRLESGPLPTLKDLGIPPLSAPSTAHRGSKEYNCRGGESEALKQLQDFVALLQQGGKGRPSYTSNFSSKVAPWLATGCLSPRRMLEDVKNVLASSTATNSVTTASAASSSSSSSSGSSAGNGLQWVEFELLWRDFFRLLAKKSALAAAPADGAGRGQRQEVAAPAMTPALALD